MTPPPPIVLSFAASDPTGGAGIQADLLTLARFGCHPLSVITALTAQDTSGVHAIQAVDADFVLQQAARLLDELPVAAFKLGVLGSAANARCIGGLLAAHPGIPVVVDPVLASGRGDPLADRQTVEVLRGELIPRATVVTPNSLEVRRLADAPPDADPVECAQRLVKLGCQAVLVTGTHDPGTEVANTLVDASGVLRSDRWPRLAGEYHGSGCTLASAIAAGLAHGKPLADAVREAQDYTWHALEAGFRPGRGQHLPNRFFGAH
jgi:hydroxymethylpyrimidine/phosphomethylpyrimidine kinase